MRSYQLNKRNYQIFTSHDKQEKFSSIYLVKIDINISFPIEQKNWENIKLKMHIISKNMFSNIYSVQIKKNSTYNKINSQLLRNN